MMRVMLRARCLWDTIKEGAADKVKDHMAMEALLQEVPLEMASTLASKPSAKVARDQLESSRLGSDHAHISAAQCVTSPSSIVSLSMTLPCSSPRWSTNWRSCRGLPPLLFQLNPYSTSPPCRLKKSHRDDQGAQTSAAVNPSRKSSSTRTTTAARITHDLAIVPTHVGCLHQTNVLITKKSRAPPPFGSGRSWLDQINCVRLGLAQVAHL
jgi:hypothetical protein